MSGIKFSEKYEVAGKAVYTSLQGLCSDESKVIEALIANTQWAQFCDAGWLKEYNDSQVQAKFDASTAKSDVLALNTAWSESRKAKTASAAALTAAKAAYDAALADDNTKDANRIKAYGAVRAALDAAGFAGFDISDSGKLAKVPTPASITPKAKAHREAGSRLRRYEGEGKAPLTFNSKSDAIEYARSAGWLKDNQFVVMKNNVNTGNYAPDDKLDSIFNANGYKRVV